MSWVWLLVEGRYGTCGVIYSGFCKCPDSQSLKRGLMQLCISQLGCFLHEWPTPWHLQSRGSSSCKKIPDALQPCAHFLKPFPGSQASPSSGLCRNLATMALSGDWEFSCTNVPSTLASSRDRDVEWDTASSSCWRGQTHSASKIREVSKVFCMNGDSCLPVLCHICPIWQYHLLEQSI